MDGGTGCQSTQTRKTYFTTLLHFTQPSLQKSVADLEKLEGGSKGENLRKQLGGTAPQTLKGIFNLTQL